jgi:hypothetical protein
MGEKALVEGCREHRAGKVDSTPRETEIVALTR